MTDTVALRAEFLRLIGRIRDAFDAPRFCTVDGEPIEVKNLGGFDPRTGTPLDLWVWHCPHVSVSDDATRWSQHGDTIHPHGHGRPRWHRLREEATL